MSNGVNHVRINGESVIEMQELSRDKIRSLNWNKRGLKGPFKFYIKLFV